MAFAALDTFQTDMNFYDRNFYDDDFLDNEFFEIGNLTYADLYVVNGYDSPVDLLFGMLGASLRADGSGHVSGTVNAMFETTYAGAPLWFADGFSIAAHTIFQAISTFGNADDRVLLRTLLSGDDIVRLSRYGDRFEAGRGNDTIRAGGGHDVIYADDGRDIVYGSGGSDRLNGGAGADMLHGGGGDDRLFGNAGNDRLNGAGGRDALTGGAGADVFIFAGRFGTDTIRDFDPDQRGEKIDLGRVAGITGFRDLRLNHLEQRGDDVLIETDDGSSIRLKDLSVDDLAGNDFIF